MKTLNSDLSPEDFLQRVESRGRAVVMLDFDGTLAPFAEHREEVALYPGFRGLLNDLQKSSACRLVIVSGRPVEQLEALLDLRETPELWGCHGWERRSPEGAVELGELSGRQREVLNKAATLAAELDREEDLEEKPFGVAFHWRGMDEDEAEDFERHAADFASLHAADRFDVQHTEYTLELKPEGRDKGTAVERVLATEDNATPAVYLGDSLTDEDAFKAITGKGAGILVSEELRSTAADAWLKPPEQLHDFLTELEDRLRDRANVRNTRK